MENRISKVILTACLTVLIGLTGFSGSVMATTPDGETPANEGVCDELMTATKGLYGLCVAYCEAQDLDEIGDKETPNNKILANYKKKMQPGDPVMPCIQPVCPCWTGEELSKLASDSINTNACTINETVARIAPSPGTYAYTAPGGPICRYNDRTTTPNISRRFSGVDVLPPEVAQSCYSQIVTACEGLPTP